MEFDQWAGEDDEEIWKIDTLQAAEIGWRLPEKVESLMAVVV